MQIFLYEFSYFLAASLAILVSLSAFSLFILTFRYERKLQTVWRALGFILLGLAFLLLIWERKSPGVNIFALVVEVLALASIFRGVQAEPKLAHLVAVDENRATNVPLKFSLKSLGLAKEKLIKKKSLVITIVVLILAALLLLPGYLYLSGFLPAILESVALIFIIATIVIQIKRYRVDASKQNLWPMVGYIFLFVRGLAMIFYRLPALNLVILRKLSLEYSVAWQLGVIATFLAFLFLGVWAWNFVKVRTFLRTYVVFISIVIVVSTVGALIFTLFTFKIIENNNLDLMLKGAQTESMIMNDKASTAMFVARLIAEDENIKSSFLKSNYSSLLADSEKYLKSAEVDILRIYNSNGEVFVSPSDVRDKGRRFSDDKFLAYVLSQKKNVKTFDAATGVLSDFVVARAIYPILSGNAVVGAVEVGYKFDNAFVDFSKEKTNLDVTIYYGKKISSTTIKTQDKTSRYVGSEEIQNDVLNKVLAKGETFSTTIDRFGELYYSAYTPLRDVNGQIIGMVAVGTPTSILLEAMRQKLVTTFMLVSLLSALISLLGYQLMPSLRLGASSLSSK